MKIKARKNSFAVRGQILHSLSAEKIEYMKEGVLVVKNGIIQFCGDLKKMPIKYRSYRILNVSENLIIPGLIDTHIHLPQMNCRNKFGGTLLPWLKKYIWPEEVRFQNKSYAQKLSKKFFETLMKNGTTTAAVYLTIHADSADIAFREAQKSGLRIIMGKVMMDQNSPQNLTEKTEESIRQSIQLCKKWHQKGLLFYAFTPRFAPTCSEKLLKETAKAAKKYHAYIQTHLSENIQEIALVQKLFPKSKNYTDVYNKAGLLTPKTILAHCIHLNTSEISLIKNKKCAVAYCPTSNIYLKSGRMPIEKMKDLNLSLGTDVGAGPTFSLFDVMRADQNMQKKYHRSFETLFYLATLGGAKALRFEHLTGNFKAGKQADFLVLKVARSFKTKEQIVSNFLQKISAKNIEKVFVRGSELRLK